MANYLPVLLVSVNANVIPDDSVLSDLPSGQVDYLSHDWREEDVWRSWRNMTRQKNEIANGMRLENASWRTWWKQRNKLKTVTPETLNWLKDSDVTWLYGPLHTAIDRQLNKSASSPSTPYLQDFPNGAAKKPILKHRSICELLTSDLPPSPIFSPPDSDEEADTNDIRNSNVKRSRSNSAATLRRPPLLHTKSDTHITRWGPNRAFRKDSPPRILASDIPSNSNSAANSPTSPSSAMSQQTSANTSANAAVLKRERSSSSMNLLSGHRDFSATATATSPIPTSSAAQGQHRKEKHISFNTFVEQCIAIDKPNPKSKRDQHAPGYGQPYSPYSPYAYGNGHASAYGFVQQGGLYGSPDQAYDDDGYDEDSEDGVIEEGDEMALFADDDLLGDADPAVSPSGTSESLYSPRIPPSHQTPYSSYNPSSSGHSDSEDDVNHSDEDEEEDDVLEIRTPSSHRPRPSRSHSYTHGIVVGQRSSSSSGSSSRSSGSQSRSRPPYHRSNSQPQPHMPILGNHRHSSASTSTASSYQRASGSFLRTPSAEKELVTIALIAPTILKTRGAGPVDDDDDDEEIYQYDEHGDVIGRIRSSKWDENGSFGGGWRGLDKPVELVYVPPSYNYPRELELEAEREKDWMQGGMRQRQWERSMRQESEDDVQMEVVRAAVVQPTDEGSKEERREDVYHHSDSFLHVGDNRNIPTVGAATSPLSGSPRPPPPELEQAETLFVERKTEESELAAENVDVMDVHVDDGVVRYAQGGAASVTIGRSRSGSIAGNVHASPPEVHVNNVPGVTDSSSVRSRSRSRSRSRTPSPITFSAATTSPIPVPRARSASQLGVASQGQSDSPSLLAPPEVIPSRGRSVSTSNLPSIVTSPATAPSEPQTRGRSLSRANSFSERERSCGGITGGTGSPLGSLSPDGGIGLGIGLGNAVAGSVRGRGRERSSRNIISGGSASDLGSGSSLSPESLVCRGSSEDSGSEGRKFSSASSSSGSSTVSTGSTITPSSLHTQISQSSMASAECRFEEAQSSPLQSRSETKTVDSSLTKSTPPPISIPPTNLPTAGQSPRKEELKYSPGGVASSPAASQRGKKAPSFPSPPISASVDKMASFDRSSPISPLREEDFSLKLNEQNGTLVGRAVGIMSSAGAFLGSIWHGSVST